MSTPVCLNIYKLHIGPMRVSSFCAYSMFCLSRPILHRQGKNKDPTSFSHLFDSLARNPSVADNTYGKHSTPVLLKRFYCLSHFRRPTFRAVGVLQTEACLVALSNPRAIQGQEVIMCEHFNAMVVPERNG